MGSSSRTSTLLEESNTSDFESTNEISSSSVDDLLLIAWLGNNFLFTGVDVIITELTFLRCFLVFGFAFGKGQMLAMIVLSAVVSILSVDVSAATVQDVPTVLVPDVSAAFETDFSAAALG